MPLDPDDDRPPYLQVTERLRESIHRGEYAPGEKLPTQEALCAEFGVSRMTIQRALRGLKDDGVIVSRKGQGSYVRSHHDLARELRRAIVDGDIAANTVLPAIPDLAIQYETSEKAVRAAIQRLEKQRLVTTRPGFGTKVLKLEFETFYDGPPITGQFMEERESQLAERILLSPPMALIGAIMESLPVELTRRMTWIRSWTNGITWVRIEWENGPSIIEFLAYILPKDNGDGDIIGVAGLRKESATDQSATLVWLGAADVRVSLTRPADF